MDLDDAVVYKGFLLLPPNGKILIKKSWQKKYCLLFKSSKFGRERLEIYDSQDIKSGQPKIITLENVIKITKNTTTFNVLTKSMEYEFGSVTEESLNEWISAIQYVAFPDEVSKITSIEEDNDLYCTSGVGVFNVKVLPSPASQKCGLENKYYTLLLTSTAIQLRDNDDNNQILYTWPYCYIRRYGYKGGKFNFEAGRKCESGEGIFFLEHSNQQEIFRSLASKMKSMKKMLNKESTTSLLDCGDTQLHAALNMEARSRSPLPPSPTSPLISTESDFSQKSFITVSDFDRSVKKPMPNKPPRKMLPKKSSSKSVLASSFPEYSVIGNGLDHYEPIDKYDKVEIRSDAWRTLGVTEVSHREQVNSIEEEEEEYISWGQVKKQVENIHPTPTNTAPSVITESTSKLINSYDRLNFFGSTGKLNSGYKQVFPVPVLPTPPSSSSDNHYDEVQVIDSVRPADDSHLGYAMIRKEPGKDALKPIPNKRGNSDDAVNHKFCNNEPYAMISKPKRV